MDQFSALVSLLPQIEELLGGLGDKLVRPEYGVDGAVAGDGGDRAMADSDAAGQKRKANHEETSDEEKSHGVEG